jgi:hypothetical protein
LDKSTSLEKRRIKLKGVKGGSWKVAWQGNCWRTRADETSIDGQGIVLEEEIRDEGRGERGEKGRMVRERSVFFVKREFLNMLKVSGWHRMRNRCWTGWDKLGM